MPATSLDSLILGTNLISDPTAIFLPPGIVLPYAGASAPTGWTFSYGQAISRTDFANLFSAIGTTYGIGDGSTTFNLPDLRGNIVAGKDDMGGSPANRLATPVDGTILGNSGGEESHSLVYQEIPSHTHGYNQASLNATQMATAGSDVNVGLQQDEASTQDPFGASTPGGGGHNNVQPTFILNYIIKY